MKNLIRSTVSCLLLVLAAIAYGGTPAINVTVSDSGGKVAYKGVTDAKGAFTSPKLQSGHYVVLLTSKNASKDSNYAIAVSAGKKKVTADSVVGAKFSAGGVALRVDVADGSNITGHITEQPGRVSKDGKKMVWIPPQAGSHLPGHWVEEGSPEAEQARTAGHKRSRPGDLTSE